MILYRKWHRGIGISASIFLILFVVTGLLLQHSSQLGLDKHHLTAGLAQSLYGLTLSTVTTYESGSHNVSQAADSLYLNDTYIPYIELGELQGAVEDEEGIWVAANGDIWLLSLSGVLLDSFTASDGLVPGKVARIGVLTGTRTDTIAIADASREWCLSGVSDWHSCGGGDIVWSEPSAAGLTPATRELILADAQGRLITWERFFIDLHSGRLFGIGGVIVADIMALLMLITAVTGITIWSSTR